MKRSLLSGALLLLVLLASSQAFAESAVIQQAMRYETQELSAQEKEGLLLMREEEKLARDVYSALAQKWDLRIFTNIAKSEQEHMDMVLVLLERYEVEDPVGQDTPGSFRDASLQSLYEALVERGSASISAALQVGAEVEELDIADLMELMEVSDNPDIRLVYQNLMKGSRNHLRSFDRQLSQRGDSYVPKHLKQDKYDEIVGTRNERGAILDPDGAY